MDLKRFFCDSIIQGEEAFLVGDEFFHAVKVTRHKIGYKLILCDGTRYDHYATVTEIGKNYLKAHVDEKKENRCENDFSCVLYVGNNKNLDSVVQKAVEMGAQAVVPFTSQHCNEKDVPYERLKKIITESSKQCGRSIRMELREQMSFTDVTNLLDPKETVCFYEYEERKKLSPSDMPRGGNVNVVIGCEGGFSLAEIESLKDKGFATYTLGKRILRVPTAVVAALAIVNEKIGGLS